MVNKNKIAASREKNRNFNYVIKFGADYTMAYSITGMQNYQLSAQKKNKTSSLCFRTRRCTIALCNEKWKYRNVDDLFIDFYSK